MADSPIAIKTQTLTRDQLAKFLGSDQRLIVAFENIVSDVMNALPDATENAQDVADAALAQANANALGFFGRRAPTAGPSVRPGDGIIVTSDAGGSTVALDAAYAIGVMRAFLARNVPLIPPPDDTPAVIAGRMFRR